MKKILLDSNFILTCVKQKIDFFEDLMEFKLIIPREIIREIEGVAKSKQKLRFRDDAKLALIILGKNKFQEIKIGKGHVDKRIKEYADKNPNLLVATLDKELKENLNNSKVVIREKSRIEVQ